MIMNWRYWKKEKRTIKDVFEILEKYKGKLDMKIHLHNKFEWKLFKQDFKIKKVERICDDETDPDVFFTVDTEIGVYSCSFVVPYSLNNHRG